MLTRQPDDRLDLVALAIRRTITSATFPSGWCGSPTELLALLTAGASPVTLASPRWPANPNALGRALNRSTPALEARGYTVGRRAAGAREISIAPPKF